MKRQRRPKPLHTFLAAVHRPGCVNVVVARGETWHAARAALALKAKVEPGAIRSVVAAAEAGGAS